MQNKDKKNVYGKEGSMTILILLLAAILFHALFFLLFKPVKNERSIRNPGKSFTLLLPPKRAEELQQEYGLSYFLASSDPSSIMKIQKEHGFEAWEKLSEASPFAGEIISRHAQKPSARQKEKDPFAGNETFAPLFLPLLSAVTPASRSEQKQQLPPETSHPVKITEKDFPFWKFSTGESISGLPSDLPGSREILKKWKDHAESYTQYRIIYRGNGEPPTLFLMRSSSVKELDELARRQLYAFLGSPFRSSAEEMKTKINYCTILWSEKLILSEMKNTEKEKQ